MKKLSKHFGRAALLAAGLMTLAPASAFAGTWRLNPDRCPDLREDYRDMRRDRGWNDRREDRHDSRVVNCPARAWTYYPSRGERRWERNSYPRQVIVYSNGRVYERKRGELVNLGINLRLG